MGIGSEDTDDDSVFVFPVECDESKCFLISIGSDVFSLKVSPNLCEPSRLVEYPCSGPGDWGSSVSWKDGIALPVLKEIFLVDVSTVVFGTD